LNKQRTFCFRSEQKLCQSLHRHKPDGWWPGRFFHTLNTWRLRRPSSVEKGLSFRPVSPKYTDQR